MQKDRKCVFSTIVCSVSDGKTENINFRELLKHRVHEKKTEDLRGKEWR